MSRIFIVFTLACSIVVHINSDLIAAQLEKAPSEKDSYPFFFKVFSKDGRESLTALCNPPNLAAKPNEVNEIDCKFTNVRISNPHERVGKDEVNIPTTVEELANKAPEYQEELKRNPRKASESWNEYMEGLEKLRQDACSASSQQKWGSKLINFQAGPKDKRFSRDSLMRAEKKTRNYLLSNWENLRDEAVTCGLIPSPLSSKKST